MWDFEFIGSAPQLWAAGITEDYLSATIDSRVKKEMGVTRRTHADSLENNILEDNSSQPSLKDYAIKYSKQSESHRGRNRRPVILCCCRWTNI